MNTQRQQEILEQKATLARERLLAVVDELDRKRHALTHPLRLIQKRLPDPAWLVFGGVAAFAGVATIATVVVRVRAKRRRQLFYVEPRRVQPSFSDDVGTRAAKALITFSLVQLGKFLIQQGTRRLGETQTPRFPVQH